MNLLLGLVTAALLAAQPATKPAPKASPGAATSPRPAVDQPDPVERAYEKLLEDDDAAQEEVDRWIRESNAFEAKGAPVSRDALSLRIEQRFAAVNKAYEEFLRQHPNHTEARIAYGSFLYETQDEEAGVAQWNKARELDPKNPAPWNNLANHYGHRGPVTQAFEYYAKAIELNPEEPVYLQNLATTVYLFRKDAMEHFNCDEKHVFDRALDLYRKALKLDPENFPLATDYAQSYYGIKPLRTQEALDAWNYALKVANDDFEREGVYIHLARVEINSALFDEARKHLNLVTNDFYKALRDRLSRNLVEKQKGTNALPASAAPASVAADATPDARPPTAASLHRPPRPRLGAK